MIADLRIQTLSQLSAGHEWRLSLPHDRPEQLLIWVTRGQGRLLLDGQRRGIGAHNAILLPARHLFALDLGRQAVGQVVILPDGSTLDFPQTPSQLRIRDGSAMGELTALIESAAREQQTARPLMEAALSAHGTLISIWLQRQLALEEHIAPRPNAAARPDFGLRVPHHATLPSADDDGRPRGSAAGDANPPHACMQGCNRQNGCRTSDRPHFI